MIFQIIVTLMCLSGTLAGNYGGGYSGGYSGGFSGYGGGPALALHSGFAHNGLYGAQLSNGYAQHYSGPLPAAVHSRRTYEVIRVPSTHEPAQLTQVDVDPVETPVAIRFVSKSSPVLIDQVHLPGEPGRNEETHSVDEPHRVVHTVTRPVIQEVREIIQPYRRLQQEVRPVLEEVNTVVARGEHRQHVVAAPAQVALAAPVAAVAVAEAPVHVAAAPVAVAHPVAVEGPSHVGGFGFTGSVHQFGAPFAAHHGVAVEAHPQPLPVAGHIGGRVQSFGY